MSIIVLVLFSALGLGIQFTLLRNPSLVAPPSATFAPQRLKAMLRLESKVPASATRFIVLSASDLLSVEAPYYSKHPEKYVLLPSDNVVSRVEMNLGQYSAMRFWTLDDLKIHARDAVLVDPPPEAVAALEQAGYKVAVRLDESLEVVTVE
jgi:hypothetical protein